MNGYGLKRIEDIAKKNHIPFSLDSGMSNGFIYRSIVFQSKKLAWKIYDLSGDKGTGPYDFGMGRWGYKFF